MMPNEKQKLLFILPSPVEKRPIDREKHVGVLERLLLPGQSFEKEYAIKYIQTTS